MPTIPFIILMLLAAAMTPQAVAQEEPEPLESDLQEKVEVRFVILDALVVDRKGRIITDLTVDDFELHLDLKPHPVTSVDIDCPEGSAGEPKGVRRGKRREEPGAQEVPRRIALVVDYKNLPHTRRIEVIDNLQRMVADHQAALDELMVVAITRRLRVEQPFTLDTDEVLATLERMKNDPSLWMEQPSPHPHEFDLFDGMIDLIRMLRDYEGRKAIVLFSDLPTKVEDDAFGRPLSVTPPAFDYDRKFETIAASATDSRVAVYTVHASGMTLRRSSERLARMALETGGRFTRYTNDLSLAYARAQRDLNCRYAVGFYDNKPELDKVHRVNLKVKRPWARVMHPAHYRFGFDDLARQSLVETAYTAPVMFQEESVGGYLVPVRPLSPEKWEAAVLLRFPATMSSADENVVRFGAKLDDHAMRGVHVFDGAMTIGSGGEEGSKSVLVVEPAYIAPGEYRLSVVVNDPGFGEPQSLVKQSILPELPKKGIYLADPILLQEAPDGLAINWSGGYSLFDGEQANEDLVPLMPDDTAVAAPIIAVTNICRLRSGNRNINVVVDRSLRGESGELLAQFPSLELTFDARERNACRRVVYELPSEELVPGAYEFTTAIPSQQRAKKFRIAD